MKQSRRFVIVLGILLVGVVASLPFMRRPTAEKAQSTRSMKNGLLWRQRLPEVTLDIRSTQNDLNAESKGSNQHPSRQPDATIPIQRPSIRAPLHDQPPKNESSKSFSARPTNEGPKRDVRPAEQPVLSLEPKVTLKDEMPQLPRIQRRHVIIDGDTLAKLAETYLGDPQRSSDIYNANRDVLSDPQTLPIGTEIVIPEDE